MTVHPRGIARVAGKVVQLLPERMVSLASRLSPGLSFDLARLPSAPQRPAGRIRLYVAPVNFAGQGDRWARAAEANIDGVAAVSMAYRLGQGFGHPVDQSVPVLAYLFARSWQRAQRDAVERDFTHVLIEAGRQPFGRIFDQTVDDQVQSLRAAGVKVAMVAHGTDIRLPSRHAAHNTDSPFRPGLWDKTPGLEREAAENARLFDRLGLPVFVSTPDLLIDRPTATWLPVVVEPDRWAQGDLPLLRERPVVVHAPSSSVVKGSELIDPVLTAMHDEGLIEFIRAENIPAERMPEFYGAADIVLDQVRIGGYGVAACEGMAAGRVVIGHVSAQTRDFVLQKTGRSLPIVESRASALRDTLLDVLARRDHYRLIATDGTEFVRNVHDGRRSAEALAPFLLG